jgi:hypothetical protein
VTDLKPSPQPSLVDLQAQVAAAREEFIGSVAGLKSQVEPAAIVKRAGRSLAGWFTDSHGGVRPERVAIAGAVVVGVIALKALGSRRRS